MHVIFIFFFFVLLLLLFLLVLVGLYEEPERPPNAVDYIKRYMGAPTGVDVDAIKFENEVLKKEVARLDTLVKELNAQKGN